MTEEEARKVFCDSDIAQMWKSAGPEDGGPITFKITRLIKEFDNAFKFEILVETSNAEDSGPCEFYVFKETGDVMPELY